MGIYNCSTTLGESIESIINQTFTDWELIMCDDGSIDNTYNIAKKYSEQYSNIKVIRNDKNQGLAYTLNHCIQYCSGEYVGRQDADDRSHPERIEKEVEFLNNNLDFDIVSTGMKFFDEKGFWGEIIPIEKPEPRDFVRQTPFCHAPSMIRRKALLDVNGYDDSNKFLRVEDYNLWFRMYANGSRGCNLIEPLYEVRDDRDAIGRRKYSFRLKEAHVRFCGYRMLRLPVSSYVYAVRPLAVGLIPINFYKYFRKLRYSHSKA
jgi:glycosyltransferase EpsE